MVYPVDPTENPGLHGGKRIVHLYFDTAEEYANLPGIDKAAPGSDAFCVETGDVYILRKDTGEWQEVV